MDGCVGRNGLKGYEQQACESSPKPGFLQGDLVLSQMFPISLRAFSGGGDALMAEENPFQTILVLSLVTESEYFRG